MTAKDIIWEMEQAALHAALLSNATADTPQTRAAYARGVRAMAQLVHACIRVTDDSIREHQGSPLSVTMFEGYSRALRMILDASEDLIPPGCE